MNRGRGSRRGVSSNLRGGGQPHHGGRGFIRGRGHEVKVAAAAAPDKPRIENIDALDKTPRVDVIPELLSSEEKFVWRINDTDGCFQLGEPVDGDDLYLFNTTIVSVSNLHLLWNGRSPKKPAGDDYIWQIRYKAYGCEIKSDPFVLGKADSTRRTFIGDKATARIRACAPSFYDYLQEMAVEFHVVRFELSPSQDLINEETMGVSFAELKDLAQSDVTELRVTLDVVSEWGYPNTIIPSEKPEVRAVFQLDATPAYFNKIKTESARVSEENQNQIKPVEDHTGSSKLSTAQEEQHIGLAENRQDDTIDQIIQEINDLEQAHDEAQYNAKEKYEGGSEINVDAQFAPQVTSLKSKVCSEDDVRQFLNNKRTEGFTTIAKPASDKFPNPNGVEYEAQSHASSDGVRQRNSETAQGLYFPKKLPELSDPSSSISSDSSSKENSEVALPELGTYLIKISLFKVYFKTRSPLHDNMMLSYVHPKFKIIEPITCTATSDENRRPSKSAYKCLQIEDGVTELDVEFDRFTEKMINEPLMVEFRMQTRRMIEPMFAFSLIPIGNVLLQQERRGRRGLSGSAAIQRIGTNEKIGIMKYTIDFVSSSRYQNSPSRDDVTLRPESNTINFSPLKNLNKCDNVYVPTDMVFQTSDDLRIWQAEKKSEFTRELKEKERAYLKILANEADSRDSQREKLMSDKLKDMSKKEKDLHQLSMAVKDREEQIKKKEFEFVELSQKVNLDNTATLENAKLSIRRMQEEHKIEISSLRRRNQEYEIELKKCRGKLEILEMKLEEKEDYISKLKTQTYERPESHISERLKLVEQENKLLKKQISEVERSRDQYKKQSQTLCLKLARLQDDRDQQLKKENESLRLQIFASKEHKEMKKDRKAVADLSNQIRTLQDSKSTKGGASGSKDGRTHEINKPVLQNEASSSNEEEIQRLTTMRSGMLHTGAYTKYDMVIKEIEKRIVGLAEGKLVK